MSLRLTQGDYTAKILEDAVKLGYGPVCVSTTAGQSVTPPDPKLLPEQPCDVGSARAHWKYVVLVTLHAFRHFFRLGTICHIFTLLNGLSS